MLTLNVIGVNDGKVSLGWKWAPDISMSPRPLALWYRLPEKGRRWTRTTDALEHHGRIGRQIDIRMNPGEWEFCVGLRDGLSASPRSNTIRVMVTDPKEDWKCDG